MRFRTEIDPKRVPGVPDGHQTPDPSQRTGWRLAAKRDTQPHSHTDTPRFPGLSRRLRLTAVSAAPYLKNGDVLGLGLAKPPKRVRKSDKNEKERKKKKKKKGLKNEAQVGTCGSKI